MFVRLKLTNCFVHQNFEINFQPGLTIISGLNGKGKTLIIEMSEFALWGTKALRGEATGYKGCKVELDFIVKGEKYSVDRSISGAKLSDKNGAVATGTTAVNKKIEELFGYTFEVYKVTNSARQGEIEAMGKMRPTERKALIDETIGLTQIEALTEWVKVQKGQVESNYKALKSVMGVAPTPLEPPPPAVDALTIRLLHTQLATLEAQSPYLRPPETVLPHPRTSELAVLRGIQSVREQMQAQFQGLTQAIDALPDVVETPPTLHPQDAELDILMRVTALYKTEKIKQNLLEKQLLNYPEESVVSDVTLHEAEVTNQMIARWKAKQKLLEQLAEFVCPNCNHHWHAEDPRLQDYKDVPEECPLMIINDTDIKELKKINDYQLDRSLILSQLEKSNAYLELNSDHSEVILAIQNARKDVEIYASRKKLAEHRKTLIIQRESIVIPESCVNIIQEIELNVSHVKDYEVQKARHIQAKLATKDIPSDIAVKLEKAEEGRALWLEYENARQNYLTGLSAYEENKKKLDDYEVTAEDWNKVLKAIQQLRLDIKGYLLPSLNKVGSHLLSLMSNGWLTKAEITEDFNMTADNKSAHLLSGAGKALVNLSFRIALGQILTNNIFSTLCLDEADQGVDIEKAPMVAKALQSLTGTIKQIIVVSHKGELVADQRIEL